jgi:hypothetical protein
LLIVGCHRDQSPDSVHTFRERVRNRLSWCRRVVVREDVSPSGPLRE